MATTFLLGSSLAGGTSSGQSTKYLLVMHDFHARSPDELSLRKGERVELIADDSEFGDGWYSGRCLATNQKGLFPQVYTTPIIVDDSAAFDTAKIPFETEKAPKVLVSNSVHSEASNQVADHRIQNMPQVEVQRGSPTPPSPGVTLYEGSMDDPDMPPLTFEKGTKSSMDISPDKSVLTTEESHAVEDKATKPAGHGMVSLVVEDTLSDIEEAISEISSRNNKILRNHNQRHSAIPEVIKPSQQDLQDSSSEYSRHDEPEDSGSEIEEEEEEEPAPIIEQGASDTIYTADEVRRWTPAEVAQYLQSRNVAQGTCDKFEEQEVTGAILMQLQMADLKELDLGSFGKRFEAWKEIEHLMDNLKAGTRARSRSESKSTSRVIKESSAHRSSSLGRGILPRIKSQHNRPAPRMHHQIDVEGANSLRPSSSMQPPGTATTMIVDTPTSAMFERPRSPPLSPARMSQQSTHRRNLSGSMSVDLKNPTSLALHSAFAAGSAVLGGGGSFSTSHQRESSFDKNWKLPAISGPLRPSTSTGASSANRPRASSGTTDSGFTGDGRFSDSKGQTPTPTERSYFSGGESTPRERRVLQKKSSQTSHTRKPSYTDEHRVRTGTAHSRHSRIGSAETVRGEASLPGSSLAFHIRGTSKDKINRKSNSFSSLEPSVHEQPRISQVPKGTVQGKRSASDTITGPGLPNIRPPSTNQSLETDQISPSRDMVASPTSIGSIDILEKKGSVPSIANTADSEPRPSSGRDGREKSISESQSLRATGAERKKPGKKNTSAYLEGLRNITPFEAAKEGDFSGWMQKRGSGNMGTWKPRFFVLQGRRLSYFYSENDTKERGLIDVTSHKVLPATEDRLVKLQASLAAVTSPSTSPASTATSPAFYHSLNSPSGDASGDEGSPGGVGQKSPLRPSLPSGIVDKREHTKERGWFTFKLVPPGPGASKGVTFTPPRLHYLATDSKDVGRAWMAAIMKATIELDPNTPVKTSYSAATISLTKARALKARPPEIGKTNTKPNSVTESMGLAISGVDLDTEDADVEENGEDSRSLSGAGSPATVGTNRTGSVGGVKPHIFESRNLSNVFLDEEEGRCLGTGSIRTPSLERLLAGDTKEVTMSTV